MNKIEKKKQKLLYYEKIFNKLYELYILKIKKVDFKFGFKKLDLNTFFSIYENDAPNKMNNIIILGSKQSGKKTLFKLILKIFYITFLFLDEYKNYFSFYKNYFIFIPNQNLYKKEEDLDKILINSSLLIYITNLLTNQEIEKILNISKRIKKLNLKKKIVIIQNNYQIYKYDFIHNFRKLNPKNEIVFKKHPHFLDKYENN